MSKRSTAVPPAADPARPAPRRYWAFISYNHDDEDVARSFHEALETYRIPRHFRGQATPCGREAPSRFYPVLLDEAELPGSADLGAEIAEALERSDYLVVICSPRAASSRWVDEEIRVFKSLGREARIMAVVVDGEPRSSLDSTDGAREAFPRALLYRVVEGSVTAEEAPEPLWVDRRPGTDERAALLRVVAGMLGADLGELIRRDVRRRRIRWALRSTFALAAAVATIWAGGIALDRINYERALGAADELMERDPLGAVDQALNAVAIRDGPVAVETLRHTLENAAERVRLRHPAPVTAVSTDRSAHRVAATTPAGVFLWRVPEGEGGRFEPADGVGAAAISYDGRRLAGAEGRDLVVWDLESGQELASFVTDVPISVLAFDPAGARVAAGHVDGRATVWRLGDGEGPLLDHHPHTDSVSTIAFSPDGASVVTGGLDLTVAVWNADTGDLVRTEDLGSRALSAALGPEGEAMLTVAEGLRPRIWPPRSSRLGPWAIPVDGAGSGALGPSGSMVAVATAGPNPVVRVFAVPARDSIPLVSLFGHRERINEVRFTPHPPPLVVTAGADSTVRIWDPTLSSRVLGAGHGAGVRDVRVNADGTRVLTRGLGLRGGSFLWDFASASIISQLGTPDARVADAAFDPSGTRLATAGLDGVLRVHDAADGTILDASPGLGARPFTVTFLPDGNGIASGLEDGSLRLWVPGADTVAAAREAHEGVIRSLTRSPGGTRLATGGDDGAVGLWTARGRFVRWLPHPGSVTGAAFSDGDSLIVTTSRDSVARVWDVSTGTLAAELVHPGVVRQALFGAGSDQLATVASDGRTRLWSAVGGEWTATVLGGPDRDGRPDPVEAVEGRAPERLVYSHDGSLLALVGLGPPVTLPTDAGGVAARRLPLVELWSSRGVLQSSMPGHRGSGQPVMDAAFTPDDRWLLTASMDGSVRKHPVSVRDLQDLARRLLNGHRLYEARDF